MAKMWAGRFKKEADSKVNDFNSSISFDARMYKQDIMGSIAHAAMLGKTGVIGQMEADKIMAGLSDILGDLESGALSFDPDAEDIHMFVEAELTKRLGDTGKRLHTARSRNDQVALDIRLYLRDAIEGISANVRELAETLCAMASEHLDTIMPGSWKRFSKSSSASSATWPRSIRRRLCPATPICSGPSPSPSATT